MYTIKFRNRLHLSSFKIVLLFCLLSCISINTFAQSEGFNMLEDDDRQYYFGITAGFNNSQYRIFHSTSFIQSDTIKEVTPKWNAGFQVGINGNLRLNSHISLRLTPQFVLTQKTIDYKQTYKRDTTLVIESIMMHLPLSIKFNSDRIGNFRFYTFTGAKFDYDFNSNTRSRRNDEVLKVKPIDFGYDIGVGFDFYYPNFIFSPEIKVSNGFGNIQKKDANISTSNVLDVINTRMIFFSFTIGG
jgi:Outer membrane protein beta-barrel domain